jgi:hypothetical protein
VTTDADILDALLDPVERVRAHPAVQHVGASTYTHHLGESRVFVVALRGGWKWTNGAHFTRIRTFAGVSGAFNSLPRVVWCGCEQCTP